ncbi:DUF4397 domain-containing protein [Mucilaginibacter glaciei]|uniref:DUF4397 domain-containing protein n=1 Tax=Mucilaginibacter glaciei TaxID=2772109 RepID=A0A926NUA5_9SPHI|nr:DUF4397 domain-containing protein [Mucilaginibacter glaciei]MBD1394850.1 DUF4397 domain-containing protein [Mucilaginibacter glaciei]
MTKNNRSYISVCLCLFIIGVMVLPMLSSCGKSGVSVSTANAQINLINVSPDVRPFNLYSRINNTYILFGTTNYTYPTPSGYFLLNTVDSPYLLRPTVINNVDITNLLPPQGGFKPNVRYTWLVTGLRSDSSLTSLIVADTGSAPAIGRGKVRFINASTNAPLLNMTLNDTTAFSRIGYKGVTKYLEVTAGNYNINVSASSAPGVALKTLTNVTILDGSLYTIYAYGLTGRADTAAFNTNVILNTIPLKYN